VPKASLDHVSEAEPYNKSPVVTVFAPVPPLVAATVPSKEIVRPDTLMFVPPVYVRALLTKAKLIAVVPNVITP
jgi:hypothetical protein